MNINFMRKVDFWAGVPLTFLFTLLAKLTGLFTKSPNLKNLKRVLYIELSEMGSAILADASLKRTASKYEVYFVIFKKNAVSLQLLKTVSAQNVFCIREDSFLNLVTDSVRFIFWCRKNKIEATIDLELFSRFTALLSLASMAPVRIGFINPNGEGLYRGQLLTHPVAYNPHIHISKNFVLLTEPLFAQVYDGYYVKRHISDSEVEFLPAQIDSLAQGRIKNKILEFFPNFSNEVIVLVNVNAGDLLPLRKWPQDNFVVLIQKLLKEFPQCLVLMTGSKSEKNFVGYVSTKVSSPRCINFAGCVAFEDLPALYSLSKSIVTNDSGPAHFASAVGLKTFVLFGPETPHLYGPLKNAVSISAGLGCAPCVNANNHRNTACKENLCMKAISPDFVFDRLCAFLTKKDYTTSDASIVYTNGGIF